MRMLGQGLAAEHALPLRLQRRTLVVARSLWFAVVLGSLGLAAAGMVRAFEQPALIAPEALAAAAGSTMQRLILVAVVVPLIGTAAVGGVVFWRRSSDPMALLFTVALILPFVVSSRSLLAFADHPTLRFAIPVVTTLALVALALVLAMFPNGRFEPPWAVWIAPAMAVLLTAFPQASHVLMRLPDAPAAMRFWPNGLIVMAWSALMLLGFVAQVHRYRHVSDATERLQTKWAMAPFGLLVMFILAVVFVPAVVFGASERWVGWGIFAAVCLSVAVPVMLANAVLRYRLYAIDQVISRTVSYALIISILAVVYATGVVAVGAVMSSVTAGGGGNSAVAASTLIVAALIRPVRRAVHAVVDQRFNRTSYDARRLVNAFSHGLRDEVDLAQISDDLIMVAGRALQPSGAVVWLADAPVAAADRTVTR